MLGDEYLGAALHLGKSGLKAWKAVSVDLDLLDFVDRHAADLDVFDDLERRELPIGRILGYVDPLVERRPPPTASPWPRRSDTSISRRATRGATLTASFSNSYVHVRHAATDVSVRTLEPSAPRPTGPPAIPASPPGPGGVERHGGADERLERLLVDLVAPTKVDGPHGVAPEAGVEHA